MFRFNYFINHNSNAHYYSIINKLHIKNHKFSGLIFLIYPVTVYSLQVTLKPLIRNLIILGKRLYHIMNNSITHKQIFFRTMSFMMTKTFQQYIHRLKSNFIRFWLVYITCIFSLNFQNNVRLLGPKFLNPWINAIIRKIIKKLVWYSEKTKT